MTNGEIFKMPANVNFKTQSGQNLHQHVHDALHRYFEQLGGIFITDLYNMVLAEVEEPLLRSVMRYVKGNQSKAAILLGLSRGTLRKKLKQYGMLRGSDSIVSVGKTE